MAAFSNASKQTMLDQLVTTDGPFYVALFVGDPAGAGVEENGPGVGGTAYARKAITFGAASGGNKANSAAVVFDNGGATDWDAGITHWALYDALTLGNLVASGALGGTRDMSIANATLTFNIGDIDLNLND